MSQMFLIQGGDLALLGLQKMELSKIYPSLVTSYLTFIKKSGFSGLGRIHSYFILPWIKSILSGSRGKILNFFQNEQLRGKTI